MKKLERAKMKRFQNKILSWYKIHQRDLPWRNIPFDPVSGQRDPYKILVSEIMLQQTQVSRVIPKYEAWLNEFPTLNALAKAKTSDVLRLWSGLGYNRRAVYLQKAAKAILVYSQTCHSHERENPAKDSRHLTSLKFRRSGRGNDGEGEDNVMWPKTVDELKKLPGIGEYTARAIACFAFDQQIAVVDTNIRKVILTKFRQNHPELVEGSHPELKRDSSAPPQNDQELLTDKEIQKIAEQLLPNGKAYAWNQALMDYASVMLKKEKIPLKTQSKFKGSNRYYRGQIVKLLIQYKVSSISYFVEKFDKNEIFVEKIVKDLERDGLIVFENKSIRLNE